MLTPEEQTQLDLLMKKSAEPSVTSTDEDGKIIRLLPGGRQDGTPLVEKLRAIVKDAENGRYLEFVFIGVETDASRGANVQWCPETTFRMRGALSTAHHLLMTK